MPRPWTWIAATAGMLGLTAVAAACTVPVFRYALERWEADRFQVIVYHDGPLSPNDAEEIAKLEQQSAVEGGPLNIELIRYDVRAAEPPKLLDAQPPQGEPLPRVEVRLRNGNWRDGTIAWERRWAGPLATAVARPGLFESPARQQIVQRLLAGHSAVWLLVTPSALPADEAVTELQRSLDAAAEKIPLPQGIGLPGSELLTPVPLEIRFSVLPIRHDDPAEARFLELLASHADSWQAEQAYVVPIFGRGRALEVLPHGSLDGELVEEISAFLCGACSCQVKQANPGFDLLIAASWEESLFGPGPAVALLADRGDPAEARSAAGSSSVAIPSPTSTPGDASSGESSGEAAASTAAKFAPDYVVIPAGQADRSAASAAESTETMEGGPKESRRTLRGATVTEESVPLDFAAAAAPPDPVATRAAAPPATRILMLLGGVLALAGLIVVIFFSGRP